MRSACSIKPNTIISPALLSSCCCSIARLLTTFTARDPNPRSCSIFISSSFAGSFFTVSSLPASCACGSGTTAGSFACLYASTAPFAEEMVSMLGDDRAETCCFAYAQQEWQYLVRLATALQRIMVQGTTTCTANAMCRSPNSLETDVKCKTGELCASNTSSYLFQCVLAF